MRLYGTYIPAKWDEKTIEVIEDHMKLTKVTAEFTFEGDIDGLAKVEYLMFYSSFTPDEMHNSQAQYVGQIRIVGTLHGKSGSFVVNDSGSFIDGVANSELSIINGSGTGDLAGISGVGEYAADQKGCTWEMEVSLGSI
jgi:hypothetical protein